MKGFEEIIATLQGLTAPAALATLVKVEGSSYRLPGAKLLLGPEGPRVGAISGGCLESDVAERTREVLDRGANCLLEYDMGSDLDLIWGTGMGCEGKATLLLEPMTPGRLPPWVPFCGLMLARRRTCVLATVYATSGDVPASPGDRFAYDDGGHGLLPIDPRLSVELHRLAMDVHGGGAPGVREVALPGGTLQVSLERVSPPLALHVYGAGESARPLVALAKQVGWTVGVLDHRPAMATAERFPLADLVRSGSTRDILSGLVLDARTAVMVMTHVYARDREALEVVLPSGAGYVGLQGNRGRSRKLLREMEADGLAFTAEQLARLHYPAGLDLGAEAPEAIALSMLAEAHAVLCGRHGGHLRDRAGSIH